MTKPQRGGEPLVLAGGELGELAFDWAGDRYQHTWRFPTENAGNSSSQVGLQSIESGSDVTWPVSPPLQQIHRQSFADGREVVFGVGMAGRGHWSASFTLVPELRCWIVELACRASIAPEALLSSYRLRGTWSSDGRGSMRCLQASQPLRVEAAGAGSVAALSDDLLRIRPSQITSVTATQQWAFKLSVAG